MTANELHQRLAQSLADCLVAGENLEVHGLHPRHTGPLLTHARALTAAAQELDNQARGLAAPKTGD